MQNNFSAVFTNFLMTVSLRWLVTWEGDFLARLDYFTKAQPTYTQEGKLSVKTLE